MIDNFHFFYRLVVQKKMCRKLLIYIQLGEYHLTC